MKPEIRCGGNGLILPRPVSHNFPYSANGSEKQVKIVVRV
jgi:hypothetical protein